MNGFNLSDMVSSQVGSTNVSAVYYGATLIWPLAPPHDYSQDYLTIESLEDNNTISWVLTSTYGTAKTIQWSTDMSSWTSATSTTSPGTTLTTLNNGDKLYLRGSETKYGTSISYYSKLTSDKTFNIYGNIMSLIHEDNFVGQTTLSSTYTFCGLFYDSTSLIDASNLILPATTLINNCYRAMFSGCSSLTIAPVLPATTLVNNCYYNMFLNCTSLTAAPALPATTLANGCYREMFKGCSSLVTAPALPATTLIIDCYRAMFSGCSSLTTAPVLPATTLVNNCYSWLFQNCSSLNYIKAMFTTTPSTSYTSSWVSGVAATGTFVKNSTASWTTTGNDGIPSGWTVQTASE